MGGGASKRVENVIPGDPDFNSFSSNVLGLNETKMKNWWKLFAKIEKKALYAGQNKDKSSSRRVTMVEFLDHFGLEMTDMSQRVFCQLRGSDEITSGPSVVKLGRGQGQVSTSGELDFCSFFIGLHDFCILTHKEIMGFCFEIFDKDKSGEITSDEIRSMIGMVYGMKSLDERVTRLMKDIDSSRDGRISYREFLKKPEALQRVTQPLTDLQKSLRNKCFGRGYWTHVEDSKQKYQKKEEIKGAPTVVEVYHGWREKQEKQRQQSIIDAEKKDEEALIEQKEKEEAAQAEIDRQQKAGEKKKVKLAQMKEDRLYKEELERRTGAEARPSPWTELVDLQTGATYYYNADTRLSQWSKPSELCMYDAS